MQNMKYLRTSRIVAVSGVLLALLCVAVPRVHAAEGGGSNYTPGFYGDFGVAVAPEPGFYLRNDLYYYTGDASGEQVVQFGELRTRVEVDAFMYMLTGLKVLDAEILGGRFAFGGFVPVLYTDLSADVALGDGSASVKDDRTLFGDPGFVPASLFWNFGNFHVNVSETIIVPLGSYDVDEDVNGGLNYWTFETVVAGTYLHPEKGFELSAALGYLYNTENDDTDYQTGQEFHVDFMVNQFLSETFAVGVHGFYYKQITGDSGSGAVLGDFKGEAAGIGPALMWIPKIKDKDVVISLKWLHEFDVEHRLEGDHVFLNATLAF